MIYQTIQKCVNLEIKKKIKFDKDDGLTENQRSFIILSIGSKGKYKVTNGVVDVVGDFNCSGEGIKDFMGIKFGNISGSFNCCLNQLTSLEGAPQKVGGGFYCSNNKLKSLVGAPQKVGGNFYCYNNKLTSLEGAPQEVGGDFDFDDPLEKAFELIYKKLKLGIPYGVALLASKSKISKDHWDKLDKSSIDSIDPEEADNIEKGGSFLSRVGIL